MDIESLRQAYSDKRATPTEMVQSVYAQIGAQGESPIWISLVGKSNNLARAAALEALPEANRPALYGIPFAVKDNFDISGMDTTAGCPAFSYEAKSTAHAVQRLLDAGAILIGKANMDQFATGLVGTRSPYGVCTSVFNDAYISGGSSSGSAAAVARGLVSFSLGTDTAGSGRVPAAFNQLVGLKPTRGLVSTTGLVPACRSLDCVSVFAETCADAHRVLQVIGGADAQDSYSRSASPGEGATPWVFSSFRFGVPREDDLEFFGDADSRQLYWRAVDRLRDLGGEAISFDYECFRDAAALLYKGPWVAERLAAIEEFVASHSESMDPVVARIIHGASRYSAVDGFRGEYALGALRQKADSIFNTFDFMVLPTAPTTYTIAEMMANPIELNSNLGYYTNFVNLLDLAAVAVPAGFGEQGLPFGVSLIGKAFTDSGLLGVADKLHRKLAVTLGGSQRLLADTRTLAVDGNETGCLSIAVVGAHLSGEPLNWQLRDRKARLVRSTRTHSDYRLFALPNTTPPKPALVYSPGFDGKGIEVEVWAMPEDTVGSFLNGIPAPLCLGTVRLEDGSQVKGFLCEPAGIVGAEEITSYGGWRSYIHSQ